MIKCPFCYESALLLFLSPVKSSNLRGSCCKNNGDIWDTFDTGRGISSFYKSLYVNSLHRALHRILYKPLYVFTLHRTIYRMDRPAALNQPIYDTRDTFDFTFAFALAFTLHQHRSPHLLVPVRKHKNGILRQISAQTNVAGKASNTGTRYSKTVLPANTPENRYWNNTTQMKWKLK